MNTEEKAKAYEMALEAARKELGVDRKEWEVVQQVLCNIFPELAESEDEWVPKELIEYLKQKSDYCSCWIAWLEKQKEQKPLTTEETELNSIAFLEQMGYTCIPPGKEQNPAEWSDTDNIGWDEAFACVTRAEKSAKNEEELQNAVTAEKWLKEIKFKYYVHPVKQEWSEFDEDCLRRAIWYVENPALSVVKDTNLVLWLQSIPGRFNLQPKKEWSEEDEKMYKMLSSMIHGTFVVETQETQDKLLSWLKSLTLNLKKKNESIAKLCSNELSEEDEGELQNAIDALEFLGKKGVYKSESGYDAALQAASWLKNIPERFNLQPKEEWSEEDKQYFDDLIVGFEKSLKINRCYFTSYDVDWLKSKFNGNSCK